MTRSERPSLPGRDKRSGSLASQRARPTGLGLRTQIGLALATSLGLSVILIGLAVDRLATRSLEIERHQTATLGARAVAAIIHRPDAPALLVDDAEAMLLGESSTSRGDILGFELLEEGRVIESRGVVDRGIQGQASLGAHGLVRVWVAHPGDAAARRLGGLIVVYALVTAIAILYLSYVLLTRLIVRPVEALERTALRLARGDDRDLARIEGAREVASLALTFNEMVDDLRAERRTLETRLTELEQALKQLEQAKNSLEQAQAGLVRSEKLASVGRLAAGVAHEIGNPLAAILGFVELLRGGGLEASDEAEFLKRIQSETERIHRTIRGLLDFARKPAESAGQSTEIAGAVDDAVHLVTPQKDLHRVRIERRIADTLPKVVIDPDHLTQILLNLLLNAADAIESKGARDGEDAILIEATRDEDDAFVTLRVTDSGPGIDASLLTSIFEPFFTTKPSGRGTGLGLAVCQTIVEQVGGTIRASNAEGGGACFEIRLRVAG